MYHFTFNPSLVDTRLFTHLWQNIFPKILFCTCSASDTIFCFVFSGEHDSSIPSWNLKLSGQRINKKITFNFQFGGYCWGILRIPHKACSINLSPKNGSQWSLFSAALLIEFKELRVSTIGVQVIFVIFLSPFKF